MYFRGVCLILTFLCQPDATLEFSFITIAHLRAPVPFYDIANFKWSCSFRPISLLKTTKLQSALVDLTYLCFLSFTFPSRLTRLESHANQTVRLMKITRKVVGINLLKLNHHEIINKYMQYLHIQVNTDSPREFSGRILFTTITSRSLQCRTISSSSDASRLKNLFS